MKDRDETKTQVSILNLLILIKLTSVEMVEKAQKDQTKPNLKEHETIQTILFKTAIVGPIKVQVYAHYDVSFRV